MTKSANGWRSILNVPGNLVGGTLYPLRALRLFLATPRLWGYVLIPIGVNLLLGIALYGALLYASFEGVEALFDAIGSWHLTLPQWTAPAWLIPQWHLPNWLTLPQWTAPQWFESLIDRLPNWAAQLAIGLGVLVEWLVRAVLTLLLLILTGFVLLQFGVLLGAPWYGKLSEEIEKLKTGQLVYIEVSPFREIGRAILYELKKLAISLGVGIPLLLLNFFPGVGTIVAAVLGVGLAATIVCLDFCDGALERRRLRFRDKLGLLTRSLPTSGTFGLVCLGLVSIPFVNLLAIPVCVAAGTLFCCDRVLPMLPAPPVAKDELSRPA